MAVTAVPQGAYNTMVKLSDGSITSMGRFNAAPGGRTITGLISGAYNAQVYTSTNAIKALAAHTRAAGGATIARLVGGSYGGLVVDGGMKSVSQWKRDAEVAAAAVVTIEEAEMVLSQQDTPDSQPENQ